MPARLVLVAALLLALAIAAPVSATPNGPGDGRQATRAQLAGVNFISVCRFSHRAPDDPIVHPGHSGMSHDHSFVGNVSTSASSTLQSLLAAGTTCQRRGDTAAYWMPTLFVNGAAVAPTGATIYYRRRSVQRLSAFPPGLKVIAGNANAAAPQPRRVTFWNCGAMSDIPPSSTAPTCPDAQRSSLRLHVTFPDCWDGSRLDSPDHQSHMTYSMRNRCPATHPVAVPAISLIYRYPTTGGPGVALASGGQLSAHADFFNAWRQGQLTSLVNRCLNRLRHCARGV